MVGITTSRRSNSQNHLRHFRFGTAVFVGAVGWIRFMGSAGVVAFKTITAAFDALDAAVDKVMALDVDAVGTVERLQPAIHKARQQPGRRQGLRVPSPAF